MFGIYARRVLHAQGRSPYQKHTYPACNGNDASAPCAFPEGGSPHGRPTVHEGTNGVATDTPAVCRLCLAVTGGRQCFEPVCPGGVATDGGVKQ